MKLTFIGSGSAFTVGGDNFQSNMILESDTHKKLLIDCGTDARLALHELGLSYKDIDAVYISHLHADHCGGLEWLALSTKFDKSRPKVLLFIHPDLEKDLWKVLSTGLNALKQDDISLSTYFDVRIIQNLKFDWEKIHFNIFQSKHIEQMTGWMPCYGIQFTADKTRVMITSDTQFVPELFKDLYRNSDLIFHDCELSNVKTGVHSHYEQLKTLPEAIKNKMWLYHIQPVTQPDAKAEGFRGFVKKGQCFDLTTNVDQ